MTCIKEDVAERDAIMKKQWNLQETEIRVGIIIIIIIIVVVVVVR